MFEGEQHGVAAYAQLLRQHAARRETRRRLQTAASDQLHQLAIDLPVQQLVLLSLNMRPRLAERSPRGDRTSVARVVLRFWTSWFCS